LTGVISTAEALERKPPEKRWGTQADPADDIQVAGMILGLRVQKSKRDQKLYAQATLEDATGKIELICFLAGLRKVARAIEDGGAGDCARRADGR
jgi:DNA polymerase-3 subunit alpha